MKIKSKKQFIFFGEERFTVEDWRPNGKVIVNDLPKKLGKYSKKILQVDGGGIMGVLPVYQLYNLECKNGAKSTNELFDEFWGCSTGAIICGMVNLGYPVKEIMKFYIEQGPKVFKEKFAKGWFGALYDTSVIEKLLKQYFSNITFKKLKEKTGKVLHIMVVDAVNRIPLVCNYKTTPDWEVWAAIRASMSAPFYFGAFEYKNSAYFDGGTGQFGCTAIKAINKAIYKDKLKNKDFYLLSLGTGYSKIKSTVKKIKKMGKLRQGIWTFLYAREESVKVQERQLKYRKKDFGLEYYRWNIEVPKELDGMDKTDNLDNLIEIVDK